MTERTADTLFWCAVVYSAAALLFVAFCSLGCVTRTTVCVESARGIGPAEAGLHRDTIGASVCADLERR